LGGSPADPTVLDRCQVELSDPTEPHSRQPYHAATGEAQLDPEVIARLTAVIARCAREAIAALLARYRHGGYHPMSAAVVASSLVNPLEIRNLHMRAHAHEGQLFRAALVEALGRHGLPVLVVPERELVDRAAAGLGRSLAELRAQAVELGRSVGPPWRSDHKAATLAAWLALAAPPGRPQGA